MDSSVYTAFAHNIRLVDGVYLQESVSSYADVINALTEGGGIHTYTAVDGDTVESVVNATGVSFDSSPPVRPRQSSSRSRSSAATPKLSPSRSTPRTPSPTSMISARS